MNHNVIEAMAAVAAESPYVNGPSIGLAARMYGAALKEIHMQLGLLPGESVWVRGPWLCDNTIELGAPT